MKKPLILAIETATRTCSVALARGEEILGVEESHGAYQHAEKLAPFIQNLLEQHGIKARQLDAVGISKGPGSYTGLRIGVSMAKGICFATGVPLYGVETLDSMAGLAAGALKPESGKLVPMIDARRMEVYTALYDHAGQRLEKTQALVVDSNSFRSLLEAGPVYFFGDGAAKCREVLNHPHAVFPEQEFCSARGLVPYVLSRLENGNAEDLASFEPYYLKDFVAGKGSVVR